MSYYTQLQVNWNDLDRASGDISVEDVLSAAKGFVREHDWSEDLLVDLRSACNLSTLGPPGFNRALSYGIIDLMEHVSRELPDVTFFVKGSGEEFWDIWVREFRNGAPVAERGPFDELGAPIPEELREVVAARGPLYEFGSPTPQEPLASDGEAAQASDMRKHQRRSWLSRLLNP